MLSSKLKVWIPATSNFVNHVRGLCGEALKIYSEILVERKNAFGPCATTSFGQQIASNIVQHRTTLACVAEMLDSLHRICEISITPSPVNYEKFQEMSKRSGLNGPKH